MKSQTKGKLHNLNTCEEDKNKVKRIFKANTCFTNKCEKMKDGGSRIVYFSQQEAL